MSSPGSEIFDMVKDDSRLKELKSKLISQGVHLGRKRNNDGETLLHCAVQDKKAKRTVKELVDHFKPEMPSILACRTKKGYSPLHLVAEHGDLPMMEEMLEGLSERDRLELLRVKDIRGRTPVHWAAAKDKTDIVKYMLQSVSVDAHVLLSEKDSSGQTTPHETAGRGRGTLLDLMLGMVPMQRFDMVMNKDNKGRNLLILSIIGGKPEAVEAVLRDLSDQQIYQLFTVAHNLGQNPFHIAMEKNNLAALKILLTTLAKFQVSDEYELLRSKDAMGLTCLHTAVKEKSHKALSALLDFIQPEEKMELLCERNRSGNTVLHKAVSKKDAESTKIIMTSVQATNKHQLVSQTNHKQQSVLQYAVVKQHTEMVKQLLEYCDPAHLQELFFMTDVSGDTLLHDSSSRGVIQITAHLLDAIAIFSDRYKLAAYPDRLYRTALHRAVNAKSVESVKCILDKLDSTERFKLVKQKQQGGPSALAVAIAVNQPEIIKVIMNYFTAEQRKDILLQRDQSHDTPLHNACSSGLSNGIAGPLIDLKNKLEDLKKGLLQGIHKEPGFTQDVKNAENSAVLMESLIDTLDVFSKAELLKSKNLQGQNVVHVAASNCSLVVLRYLVEDVSADKLLDLLIEIDEDGHTALSSACVKSRKENVQFMLNTLRNCDGSQRLILSQDLHGNSVLHLAMKTDCISQLLPGVFVKSRQKDFSMTGDLVKTIVNNINQNVLSELLKVKNVKGKTPLHLAMKSEAHNAAKVILDHLPQDAVHDLVKQQDLFGKTPLQKALDSSEMMRMLLSYISARKYDILSEINEDHQSCLHLVAQLNESDTALLILEFLRSSSEKQLQVMAMKDCQGQTFLHLASSKNPELIRRLVQSEVYNKFIINLLPIRDDHGQTAADIAEDEDLQQQLNKLQDEPVVHLPADPQQLLAEDPVNSNPPDKLHKLMNLKHSETKQSILHAAILSGRTDVIKHLKEQLNNQSLWTALLLEKDWLDQNCIHIAVQKGDMECLHILIDKELKSSPDLCLQLYAPSNTWSEHHAHIAVRLRNTNALEWMMEGLSSEHLVSLLKHKDFRGQTVLHAAAKLGIKRVNVLLSHASSKLKISTQKELVDSRDSEGCTAADVAVQHPQLRRYLLSYTDYYYLAQPPRCLVFYMTSNRPGAQSEAQTLTNVLAETDLTEHEDMTKHELMGVIKETAEKDPISGLVVVVMAHGDRAVVYDSTLKEFRIQEIICCMNNPKLDGKPKLLVIQACQGHIKPRAGLNSDVLPPATDPNYTITGSDFMVLCSTIPGFMSLRNYFIPKFADHLQKCSDDDGVYQVYEKTSQEMKDDLANQKPICQSTLAHKFALKRVWTE